MNISPTMDLQQLKKLMHPRTKDAAAIYMRKVLLEVGNWKTTEEVPEFVWFWMVKEADYVASPDYVPPDQT